MTDTTVTAGECTQGPVALARWHEEIANPGTRAYICLDSAGDVSGFAATREVELLHFGTSARTWGSGLAQALHDAVLAELAATAPVEATYTRLRVFEDNQPCQTLLPTAGEGTDAVPHTHEVPTPSHSHRASTCLSEMKPRPWRGCL